MIKKLIIMLVVLCTYNISFAESISAKCEYINNYDGDTFTCNVPEWKCYPFWNNIKIRVRGVDAPEIKIKKGTHINAAKEQKEIALDAKQFTEKLLRSADSIELDNIDFDKYGGRYNADVLVHIGDTVINLAEYLVSEKKAVWKYNYK